jgi:HD superfamily phosphodiesterase
MWLILTSAIQGLVSLCETRQIPDHHGLKHALAVLDNAAIALRDFNLSFDEQISVLLAALLHDIDDRKFTVSADYSGARMILSAIGYKDTESVIDMIKLVSCSDNGNTINRTIPRWKYIPRDADRLEALGTIGIRRAKETTDSMAIQQNKEPVYWSDESPQCTTREQVFLMAHPNRLINYQKCKSSPDLISHFFDKLLHIHTMSSGSKRLEQIAEIKRDIMIDFVIDFGKNANKAYKIDWSRWI